MKKIITMICILTTVLSLTACGEGKAEKKAGTAKDLIQKNFENLESADINIDLLMESKSSNLASSEAEDDVELEMTASIGVKGNLVYNEFVSHSNLEVNANVLGMDVKTKEETWASYGKDGINNYTYDEKTQKWKMEKTKSDSLTPFNFNMEDDLLKDFKLKETEKEYVASGIISAKDFIKDQEDLKEVGNSTFKITFKFDKKTEKIKNIEIKLDQYEAPENEEALFETEITNFSIKIKFNKINKNNDLELPLDVINNAEEENVTEF